MVCVCVCVCGGGGAGGFCYMYFSTFSLIHMSGQMDIDDKCSVSQNCLNELFV